MSELKILEIADMAQRARELRKAGRGVVLCHGTICHRLCRTYIGLDAYVANI